VTGFVESTLCQRSYRLGLLVTVIELAISPGQTGSFRVEVVRSPAGEARAEVALEVEVLLARREQLEQAILASSVASRAILPQTERPLREVGQTLFPSPRSEASAALARYRPATSPDPSRAEKSV